MTVGLVFVSHSARIAEGLVDLARQMAPDVALLAAGGTDDGGIGTSFDRIVSAIGQADTGDGAVLLCDLGSAILTAETALELLGDERRSRIVLVDAPLVEGGVAAAVAAQTGEDLAAVAAAARTAIGANATPSSVQEEPSGGAVGYARVVTVVNRDGLHARPAADFVKLASTFPTRVTVNGKDAKSLLAIMALGLVRGREVEIATEDPNGQAAVDALADLVASGFGED
ncbi:dihydroxyacetone kinase phosphoryl donor subunit DhaM [Mycetocola sp.]|jgi:PTS hybrid protein|uniref:dihydroxyacetone kinase phosphoryl donor subunit DhaM n=1 Tax=Mycetocola sp. TaxID=1871042 RepID=UPI0026372292|nr:dihydroxyacetone kinase phosphoryl donor subunit DhaM [Mycetocola sp.]MCU1560699.1 Phosphocarrier protein HPr /dihydroxyacetone kinase DhaM subunit [Mycetocola sp.]